MRASAARTGPSQRWTSTTTLGPPRCLTSGCGVPPPWSARRLTMRRSGLPTMRRLVRYRISTVRMIFYDHGDNCHGHRERSAEAAAVRPLGDDEGVAADRGRL